MRKYSFARRHGEQRRIVQMFFSVFFLRVGVYPDVFVGVRNIFLLSILFLSSCSQFWFDGIQEESDELIIQFYSHDKNKPDPAPIDITNKGTIEKISDNILEDEPSKKDCGYDGVLKYKSKGKDLLDVEFTLADSCGYAAFVMNNKVNYRKINSEGLKYLKGLNTN